MALKERQLSNFKSKRNEGSGNELVDDSRAPCLGADQKARGLWERDWSDVRSETCAVDSVFDIRGSCDPGLFVLSGTPVKCASSECT